MIKVVEYDSSNMENVEIKSYFFYDAEKMTDEEAKYHVESGKLWCQYGFTVDQFEHEILKKLFDELYLDKSTQAFIDGLNFNVRLS